MQLHGVFVCVRTMQLEVVGGGPLNRVAAPPRRPNAQRRGVREQNGPIMVCRPRFPAPRVIIPRMPQSPAPPQLPESFFRDLEPRRTTGTDKLGHPVPAGAWQPQKAMYWYDSIIDDFFANPGTTIKECAARLGRSPVTISLIVRSDLFKARYAQRRDCFNEELDLRLVGKLARVAETALDLTQEVLEKKRDSVPLPLLHQIAEGAMERLGYGPKPAQGASAPVQVNINNNQAVTASPNALREAREKLKLLEASNANLPPPAVAGHSDGGGSGEG